MVYFVALDIATRTIDDGLTSSARAFLYLPIYGPPAGGTRRVRVSSDLRST